MIILQKEAQEFFAKLADAGSKLSKQRKGSADKLAFAVTTEIKALSRFENIKIEQYGLGNFIKGNPSKEDI